MAPEILSSKPYKGIPTDVFALGVILFQMISNQDPFKEAVRNDSYYKCIAANHEDLFWSAHSKTKPSGFYVDSFKSLITSMLSRFPEKRPSILEIM